MDRQKTGTTKPKRPWWRKIRVPKSSMWRKAQALALVATVVITSTYIEYGRWREWVEADHTHESRRMLARLDQLGLLPPGEMVATLLDGRLEQRFTGYVADGNIPTCPDTSEDPMQLAHLRNTLSRERLAGARGWYTIMAGNRPIQVSAFVYEQGVGTPPRQYLQYGVPQHKVLEAIADCYVPTDDNITLATPEAEADQPAELSVVVLPAHGVAADAAFYTVTVRKSQPTGQATDPSEQPILDQWVSGWAYATAYWQIDSQFVAAVTIRGNTGNFDTLREALAALQLDRIVDFTTYHLRENGLEATKLPSADQLEVTGPPAWRYRDDD
jgi:hypothetical protein